MADSQIDDAAPARKYWVTCPECHGNGNCPVCEGAGEIYVRGDELPRSVEVDALLMRAARLIEPLQMARELLEVASSGCLPGSMSDEAWKKSRDETLDIIDAALEEHEPKP